MEILRMLPRYIAFAFAIAACGAPARAEEPREYKIEAAYLYNFFNYVTWPGYASPQELRQPTICLYGTDPIQPYLHYMERKMEGERKLNVRIVQEGASTKGCQMLFLRRLPSREMEQSIASDTLVVLAAADPLDQGGMIELLHENERVLINIHLPLLSAGGFRISSRLMDLAQNK